MVWTIATAEYGLMVFITAGAIALSIPLIALYVCISYGLTEGKNLCR